jgi:hypothetical protein
MSLLLRLVVASAVSGSGEIADPADVVAGAGTVGIVGAGAVSDPSDVVAGAGSPGISGTGALSDPADTAAGAGSPRLTGTGEVSDPADVVSSGGSPGLTGTGTISDPSDTVLGLGAVLALPASYEWLSPSALLILEAVTTTALIRDRMITVVHALAPTSLVRDKFRVYRDEGDGDFIRWAESAAASSLRRFQVLETFDDAGAETSDTLVEDRLVTFEVIVAYPQTSRAGSEAGRDRARLMREDQNLIEDAIGLRGYGNFAGAYPNASWVSGSSSREVRDGVDLLVIRQAMRYYRAV